jgi:hypothetical protein
METHCLRIDGDGPGGEHTDGQIFFVQMDGQIQLSGTVADAFASPSRPLQVFARDGDKRYTGKTARSLCNFALGQQGGAKRFASEKTVLVVLGMDFS